MSQKNQFQQLDKLLRTQIPVLPPVFWVLRIKEHVLWKKPLRLKSEHHAFEFNYTFLFGEFNPKEVVIFLWERLFLPCFDKASAMRMRDFMFKLQGAPGWYKAAIEFLFNKQFKRILDFDGGKGNANLGDSYLIFEDCGGDWLDPVLKDSFEAISQGGVDQELLDSLTVMGRRSGLDEAISQPTRPVRLVRNPNFNVNNNSSQEWVEDESQ